MAGLNSRCVSLNWLNMSWTWRFASAWVYKPPRGRAVLLKTCTRSAAASCRPDCKGPPARPTHGGDSGACARARAPHTKRRPMSAEAVALMPRPFERVANGGRPRGGPPPYPFENIAEHPWEAGARRHAGLAVEVLLAKATRQAYQPTPECTRSAQFARVRAYVQSLGVCILRVHSCEIVSSEMRVAGCRPPPSRMHWASSQAVAATAR